MRWIMSGGGPLICMEDRLRSLWAGNDGVTVPATHASTDYDRACELNSYLNLIQLKSGSALTLGDMPLETAVWSAGFGGVVIVRMFYANAAADIDAILHRLDDRIFLDPIETLNFQAASSKFVIFDSAYAGNDIDNEKIFFELPPARYRVDTQKLDPDDEISLLLHKFEALA